MHKESVLLKHFLNLFREENCGVLTLSNQKMQQNNSWESLCSKLSEDFGVETNLNGVLFLIGVRERGYLLRNFSKEEKLDLINLGCCKLFSLNNLCRQEGDDEQGWPIWVKLPAMDILSEDEKVSVLKDTAFQYFKGISI